MFANTAEQSIVIENLTDRCSDQLPFVDEDSKLVDRIQAAVLKTSGGDLAKLEEAIEEANEDWRDALESAGFANDPKAHFGWHP